MWKRIKKKEKKRNEKHLKQLWDNLKHTTMCTTGVPEGEDREKGPEKIFEEIIAENFSHPAKESLIHIPYKINPGRNTPKHILIN